MRLVVRYDETVVDHILVSPWRAGQSALCGLFQDLFASWILFKPGAAAPEEPIQIVFKTGCGDCPGLAMAKVDLQMVCMKALDVGVDEIYFATCVKKAKGLMNCPMNVDGISAKITEKFGIPVHVGTHDY